MINSETYLMKIFRLGLAGYEKTAGVALSARGVATALRSSQAVSAILGEPSNLPQKEKSDYRSKTLKVVAECKKKLEECPFLQEARAPFEKIVSVEDLQGSSNAKIKKIIQSILVVPVLQKKLLRSEVSEELFERFLDELESGSSVSDVYFKCFGAELHWSQKIVAHLWFFFVQDFIEGWIQEFAMNILSEVRTKADQEGSVEELIKEFLKTVNAFSLQEQMEFDPHVRLKIFSRKIVERFIDKFMPDFHYLKSFHSLPLTGPFLRFMEKLVSKWVKIFLKRLLGGALSNQAIEPGEGILSKSITTVLDPKFLRPKIVEALKAMEGAILSPGGSQKKSKQEVVIDQDDVQLAQLRREVATFVDIVYGELHISDWAPFVADTNKKNELISAVSLSLMAASKELNNLHKMEEALSVALDKQLVSLSRLTEVSEEHVALDNPPFQQEGIAMGDLIAYRELQQEQDFQNDLALGVSRLIDAVFTRVWRSSKLPFQGEEYDIAQRRFESLRSSSIVCFDSFIEALEALELSQFPLEEKIGQEVILAKDLLEKYSALIATFSSLSRGEESLLTDFFPLCELLKNQITYSSLEIQNLKRMNAFAEQRKTERQSFLVEIEQLLSGINLGLAEVSALDECLEVIQLFLQKYKELLQGEDLSWENLKQLKSAIEEVHLQFSPLIDKEYFSSSEEALVRIFSPFYDLVQKERDLLSFKKDLVFESELQRLRPGILAEMRGVLNQVKDKGSDISFSLLDRWSSEYNLEPAVCSLGRSLVGRVIGDSEKERLAARLRLFLNPERQEVLVSIAFQTLFSWI